MMCSPWKCRRGQERSSSACPLWGPQAEQEPSCETLPAPPCPTHRQTPPPHTLTHTLREKGLEEGRHALWAIMVEGRRNVSSFLHIYITILLTKRNLAKTLENLLITWYVCNKEEDLICSLNIFIICTLESLKPGLSWKMKDFAGVSWTQVFLALGSHLQKGSLSQIMKTFHFGASHAHYCIRTIPL